MPIVIGLCRLFRQSKLGKHAAARHHDCLLKEAFVVMIEAKVLDRDRPGALPHEGDLVRIAAEIFNVFLHPAQSLQLVVQTEVAVSLITLLNLFVTEVAKDPDPVIRKDSDDPSFGQLETAERLFAVGTGIETAAMKKQEHRTIRGFLWRIDIEIQTIFIILKVDPFPKLPVIETAFRHIEMRVVLAVLRTGLAHRSSVNDLFIGIDRFTIRKAFCLCVRDSQKLTGIFIRIAQDRSHCRFQSYSIQRMIQLIFQFHLSYLFHFTKMVPDYKPVAGT